MRLRDEQYRAYEIIAVFSDVSDRALAGLRRALESYLAEPTVLDARRNWPAAWRYPVEEIHDRAAASVHSLDVSSERALIATRDLELTVLPLLIASADRTVTIKLSHAAFDGSSALEIVRYLAGVAAGEQFTLDDRPLARLPLLRALRQVTAAGREQFQLWRRERSTSVPVVADAPAVTPPGNFVSFELSREEIRSLREEPGAALRSTKNTRLCSIAVEALAQMAPREDDRPVLIPVDLRRYIRDARITGNFVATDTYGALRTSDWSPGAISERLGRAGSNGTPVLTFAESITRYTVNRAKARIRPAKSDPNATPSVTISLLTMRHDFPEEFWHATKRRFGATTFGPWHSATLISVSTMGGTVRLSLWDESGWFDADEFENRFRALLATRTADAAIEG